MAVYPDFSLSRRKLLLATAALAATVPLGMGLEGCSSAASDSNKLSVSWWGSVDRAKKYQTIFQLYEKANPGVTVQGEYADWGPYWARYAIEASGGTLPSIVGMTERQVNAYNNNLLDFQPYVTKKQINLSSYTKQYIDAGLVGGRLTMICNGWTIPALAYNSSLCAAAGVNSIPTIWTLSDFRQAAVQVSRSGHGRLWGCADEGGSPLAMATFMAQRGKTLFTDAGMGIDAADWTAWLQFWQDLRQAGAVPPAQVTVEQVNVPFQDTLLAKGQVAMDWIDHNQILTIQQYVNGDLNLALQPLSAGAKPVALLAGTYFSIPKTTKNPDRAAGFVNFFINNPGAIKAYDADLGTLPSAYGNSVLEPTLTAVGKRCADFFSEVQRYGVVSRPRNPAAIQVETLITNANQDVGLGKQTPESAGKAYFAQAQGLMR